MKKYIYFIVIIILCFSPFLVEGQTVKTIDLPVTGSVVGMINEGYLYNYQQGNGDLGEMAVGRVRNEPKYGRGRLDFNTASVPKNINIDSVSLILASKSGYNNFGGNINILYTTLALAGQNAQSWSSLAQGNQITYFTMSYAGETKEIRNSLFAQYVKPQIGKVVSFNLAHRNETSLGIMFNPGNCYLRIYYSEGGPTPTESVTISGSTYSIAEGATAVYTATYTGTGTPSFNWSVAGNFLTIVSGGNTSQVTVRGANAGSTFLYVTAGSVTDSKQITVYSSTTNITNQTISSNANYSNDVINITNSSVTNGATVNFTANSKITIKPTSRFVAGTKVHFKISGTAFRSEEVEVEEDGLFIEPEVFESSSIFSFDKIALYPTPVKNVLNINPGSSLERIKELQLYNLSGNLLQRKVPSANPEQFHMQSYPNGFYILRILYKDGQVESRKFILAK